MDEFGHQDRAALIRMGEHLDVTRSVLAETKSQSYQLIWRDEIQPRFTSVSKPGDAQPEEEKATESTPTEAVPGNGVCKNDANLGHLNGSDRGGDVKMSENNPLRKYPRAEEVWATYSHQRTRAALGKAMEKRGSGDLWELILAAIDSGFVRDTNISSHNGFVLRMLFPEAPPRGEFSKLDLSDGKTRTKVKEIIMPAAIACREQILAQPHRVEEICTDYRKKQKDEAQAKIEQEKRARAVSQLPQNQEEVIMYGKTLWPRGEYDEYEYDQLRAAVWYFICIRDALSATRDNSPKAVALTIRLTIKHLWEYCRFRAPELDRKAGGDAAGMRSVIELIKSITILWDQNPAALCQWPHFPIGGIEGKWD